MLYAGLSRPLNCLTELGRCIGIERKGHRQQSPNTAENGVSQQRGNIAVGQSIGFSGLPSPLRQAWLTRTACHRSD
jgi:hypothetical protein